jgi:acyl dehydratase
MNSLEVGDELEPLVIESVDPGHMKTMAMLLRDPNPIHWDTEVTRQLGLGEKPINQGPISLSYLMELAIRPAGSDRAALRRFRVRFVGNVLAGQRVECTGRVVAIDEEAGTAELELAATANGQPVLEGDATIVRPG